MSYIGPAPQDQQQHRAGENPYRAIVPTLLKMKGLLNHHIASFDHLVHVEMRKILLSDVNREIKSLIDPDFFVRYTDIRVDPPREQTTSALRMITPHECRLTDSTYRGEIKVDIVYTRRENGRKVLVDERNVHIGHLPIMLRSRSCNLSNKSTDELVAMRECPMDPGGYFIVRGVERVCLVQEQQSKNRVIIESDDKGAIVASVQSKTHFSISMCSIVVRKGRLYMTHRSFTESIPIVIMLKAMGLEADQAIVELLTQGMGDATEEARQLLFPSLEEAVKENIHTQNEALRYIGERRREPGGDGDDMSRRQVKRSAADQAADFLATVLLCHIRENAVRSDWNMRQKALYVCCMVRRMLEAMMDPTLVDERDFYGNKRFETAGTLMGLLFEDLLKQFNRNVRTAADQHLSKRESAKDLNLPHIMSLKADVIDRGMSHTLSTGNWDLKRFNLKRAGVTQVLSRQSYIAALGMMTRLASSFEKSRKVAGPRALQPSQWGMVCPCDTPEGESCGLVKNFALLSQVTLDAEESVLRQALYNLGVEEVDALSPSEFVASSSVFLNGVLLGIHRYPSRLCAQLRRLRRSGRVHPHVSVFIHPATQAINVGCDGGRVVRLYMCVRNGRPALTSTDVDLLQRGVKGIPDLLAEGRVEFLDVNEANDCLIAVYPSDVTPHTTHMEIEPFTMLGVVAGIIPFPHHNQSARNTFQCAMGKQAMGCIGLNQMWRTDSVLLVGLYPQRPMCRTKAMELFDYERLGAGINAMVAVMSYSGYDIEDAQVYNRDAFDRGYGRAVVLRRHDAVLSCQDPKHRDRLLPPPTGTGKMVQRYRALDQDGIAAKGAFVCPGDILVNKVTPSPNGTIVIGADKYAPEPVVFKGRDNAVVDHVFISDKGGEQGVVSIKVVTREIRIPEPGDKFSSRHGQKGVVGLITPGVNMPFTEQGIVPDMIMNPHGFPSRMTVGKLMELVAGKAGLVQGRFGDGTAFGGDDAKQMGSALLDKGFQYFGKEALYSGITGDLMPAYVFFGPIYYQRLKHMVADKMHARSTGPRSLLTRQPTEGRARDGGLRVGEMERDCMVGYGAAMLLNERLLKSSDEFCVDVCAECGSLGFHGFCPYCKRKGTVSSVNLPYAFKLLLQEMLGMGITTRLALNRPNA